MEGVHYHAGICYKLGRGLTLVLAQAEPEFVGEAVPPVLRAPGLSAEGRADRKATREAQAGGCGCVLVALTASSTQTCWPVLEAPLGRRRGPGSGSTPSGLVGEVEVA